MYWSILVVRLSEKKYRALNRAAWSYQPCNVQNVKHFLDKFSTVLSRCNIAPCHIYSMHQTGVSTVLFSNRKKQWLQTGRNNRNQPIPNEMAVAVSASGSVLLSMFILTRKLFRDHFIRDGPTGCTEVEKNQSSKQWRHLSLLRIILFHIPFLLLKIRHCSS